MVYSFPILGTTVLSCAAYHFVDCICEGELAGWGFPSGIPGKEKRAMNRGGVALDVFCTGYEVLRETPARTRLPSRESRLEVANVDWKDGIKSNDSEVLREEQRKVKKWP